MIVPALMVGIAAVMLLVTDRLCISWYVSCLGGTTLLWANMVYLEATSADSDFDIVFFVGMIVWGLVSMLSYSCIFAVAGVVRSRMKTRAAKGTSEAERDRLGK